MQLLTVGDIKVSEKFEYGTTLSSEDIWKKTFYKNAYYY